MLEVPPTTELANKVYRLFVDFFTFHQNFIAFFEEETNNTTTISAFL